MAKTPLEEWIYYLNTGEIPEGANAPGLDVVREKLKIDNMTKVEKEAYYRHLDNIVILRDNINTERAEGRAEGEKLKQTEIARNMKNMGMDIGTIAAITGMTEEEINKI